MLFICEAIDAAYFGEKEKEKCNDDRLNTAKYLYAIEVCYETSLNVLTLISDEQSKSSYRNLLKKLHITTNTIMLLPN
jgi:hypothetical protein